MSAGPLPTCGQTTASRKSTSGKPAKAAKGLPRKASGARGSAPASAPQAVPTHQYFPEIHGKETFPSPNTAGRHTKPASTQSAAERSIWLLRPSSHAAPNFRATSLPCRSTHTPCHLTAPLNQTYRQIKFLPQRVFLPRHLSFIRFMVEACQMQQPVQHEDLHFHLQRVAVLVSLPLRRFKRNSQIPRLLRSLTRKLIDWKRQHVRRLVLLAKITVEPANGRVGCQQHRHFPVQPDRRFCPGQKAAQLTHLQRRLVRFHFSLARCSRGSWLDQDHKGRKRADQSQPFY